jgi:hypothetical protein
MKPADKTVFRISLVVFLALWLYLFLRAALVSPLHDETATFLHFIETGRIWGNDALLDANNHLLNSFFGWMAYKLFGTSFFAFRLPNVLCFALYFWGIYHLLRPLPGTVRLLSLTGIAAIPYVLEYFAYSRGYGMSLAFFVLVLVYALKLAESFTPKKFIFLLVFAYLALLANLSMLGIVCLTVVFALVQYAAVFRTLSASGKVVPLIAFAALGFALAPILSLAMKMKANGTLYYGSLDGFWEVTGRTLSRYVIFYEESWLAWLFMLVFAVIVLFQLLRLLQRGLIHYLQTAEGILAFYLAGAIAVILVLAKGFGVNYPEDRVGIYLVPLSLLLITFVFLSRMKWLSILMIAFPVSLLPKLSLSTSVFTADERFTAGFYANVKKELSEGMTLAGNPTMQLNWAMHERAARQKTYMNIDRRFLANADVIVLKEGDAPKKSGKPGYRIFACEPEAGYVAMKRTGKPRRRPLAMISLGELSTAGEYLPFADIPVQDSWRGKRLAFSIKGILEREGDTPVESVVLSSNAQGEPQSVYKAFDLRWYNGITRAKIPFDMQVELLPPESENDGFKAYIWNKFMFPMRISDCIVTVYELIPQE